MALQTASNRFGGGFLQNKLEAFITHTIHFRRKLDQHATFLIDYAGRTNASTHELPMHNYAKKEVARVLDRVIRAGLPARTVLTALGPGFTASFLSLKRAA